LSALPLTILWDIVPKSEWFSFAALHNVIPYMTSFKNIINSKGCSGIPSISIDVYIRWQWPPDLSRPQCCPKGRCTFILVKAWEMGYIPKVWVPSIEANIDKLWALSSYNSLMMIKSGVDKTKVSVMPLGVDCSAMKSTTFDLRARYNISKSDFVFGYVGGALPRKGADILLEAYKTGFHGQKNVVLLLKFSYQHGGERLIARAEEMSRDSRGPRVIVISELFPIGNFYTAINALVHPARAEGLGLTPMEAMAAGKAVIVPEIGAMNDYVSSHVGFFADARTVACTEFPCKANSLCVFPNNDYSRYDTCLELVKAPVWVETNTASLVKTMRNVHFLAKEDAQALDERSHDGQHFICTHFQWANVSEVISKLILYAKYGYDQHTSPTKQWRSGLPELLKTKPWGDLLKNPSIEKLGLV
jgi:glycosyltransferase involved in cell wall biosynthesis